MRDKIAEYEAVEAAAEKFVRSVAEGNSKYARELFIDEAVLFGYLDGKLEHGPIECVFTRDEETGLTGAHGMKPGFMKGEMLINGRGLGRQDRLYRHTAALEDGRRMEVRRQGVQPKLRYRSEMIVGSPCI